jgi:spoIIIJ-associated protein
MAMIDRQSERGKEWLETLLKLMGIPAKVEIKAREIAEGQSSWWLIIDETQLTPRQIEILLGQNGENIDVIQYLANTCLNINLDSSQQRAFTVELDGYRLRREQELLSWARQVVEQVRQTGEEVEMTPLSSAERRQVHTLLQDASDLATESRGQEPNRRLVVRLRQSSL